MPEGDTVHKIAGYLAPRLTGRTIRAGRAAAHPEVDLAGRRIEEVRVHGKHLFFSLDDGTWLRSHLGMHGSWHRYPSGQRWRLSPARASIVLETEGEVYVCFDAEEVERVRRGSVREREIETRIGPDLLAPELDLDRVVARARRFVDPDATAADLLLDQRVASGIGNVYKSEVLFLEGIAPRRTFAALDDETIRRLYGTARDLLQRNVGAGPRVTRFAGEGTEGRLWVYHRLSLPCFRCGRPIRYARIGRTNRSTYWCAACQPDEAGGLSGSVGTER
ncbi:MAG: Fpg/Nei family DNA glycosylase [Candidatus Eisenbacteria bacterium]